ncbi:MAG: alanine--tRNA ligase [Actinobacteria bacterium]|nr:alanine--tRNA ligase [Actinomycetota bacterium]
MKSDEIRKKFLAFFESKGHKVLPSSSLVPDDPTLLLTAAGMVQFKPVFLDEKKVDYTRAATVQKCLRTTDIENVGKTARHLTFFEMLGNFSFGDYFKKEAIRWGWEFVTEQLKLPVENLYVTVYQDDDEAFMIWRDEMGLAEERIFRMGDEDNFWSAGATGPCGPCSEIMYDLGPDCGCADGCCSVGCDCDRYLEIWNLVFMEYNRDGEGNLHPLPKKNIDTGAGLERIARVLQNTKTNFETDLLKAIVDKVVKLTGVAYGASPQTDISLKVIVDHGRALTFMVNDGVLPSNEGRGYVLRRLLRRAILHARLLGLEAPFIERVVDTVVETMKNAYPELSDNAAFIRRIAGHEEVRFMETLKQGLNMLEQAIEPAQRSNAALSGDFVFRLYDTFGFPLELTVEIAEEHNISVDKETFVRLMKEQRERARASWAGEKEAVDREVYEEVKEEFGKTEFLGYEVDEARAVIKAIIKRNVVVTEASEGDEVEIVLDRTPFYAEKGGQVGDEGFIDTGTGEVTITDAREPVEGVVVHVGKVTRGKISIDEAVRLEVGLERRLSIKRNHTATHLLQWALRLVLGEHVKQAGSLVEPERLRFDLTHFSAITREQLRKVEELVNAKIFENHPVRAFVTSYDFARESGATALFDKEYGDFVRLLEVGNFSRELCGGTHVGNTSEIGLFKITSEGSVGANTRRIEAVTNGAALRYLHNEENELYEVASILKTDPGNVAEKVGMLVKTIREQAQQLESAKMRSAGERITEIISRARLIEATRVIVERVEASDMDSLRVYADLVREKAGSSVLLLASAVDGKALLLAAATPDKVKGGFSAGNLIKKIAPLVGGGGGGRPDLAQAGGKDPEGIEKALAEGLKEIEGMLSK